MSSIEDANYTKGIADVVTKIAQLELDLKKYSKQVYEYGASFQVSVNGSQTLQTSGVNFVAGNNITITSKQSVNGIDIIFSSTGGGGGSQTPWTSDIDGGGYDLTNVGSASFASRVLIGGATDDTTSALQVGGAISVNGQLGIGFSPDPSRPDLSFVDYNPGTFANAVIADGGGLGAQFIFEYGTPNPYTSPGIQSWSMGTRSDGYYGNPGTSFGLHDETSNWLAWYSYYNGGAPYTQFDSDVNITGAGNANGGFYVRGQTVPLSGQGLEFAYDVASAKSYITSYDRDNSVYIPLVLSGSDIEINPSGGNVYVGSNYDVGDNAPFQVTGNTTIGGTNGDSRLWVNTQGSSYYDGTPFVVRGIQGYTGMNNTAFFLNTDGYGVDFGARYGTTWGELQATQFGATNNTPLALQPLGGNVIVGASGNTDNGSKLQVSGSASFASGKTTIDTQGAITLDVGALAKAHIEARNAGDIQLFTDINVTSSDVVEDPAYSSIRYYFLNTYGAIFGIQTNPTKGRWDGQYDMLGVAANSTFTGNQGDFHFSFYDTNTTSVIDVLKGSLDGSGNGHLNINGTSAFSGFIYANGGITSPSPYYSYAEQFGNNASTGAQFATSLGNYATALGDSSTALGAQSTANADYSTVVGKSASAFGTNASSLGYSANAYGNYSIAIGNFANSPNDNEINFSNNDSTYGTLNDGLNGYTQLDIYNGVADFQGNSVKGASIIKTGGTSAQFLKADGSVDSTTYLPYETKGTATLVSGTKAITISGLTSSNQAFVQLVTPSGTLGAMYKAVCTTNTLTITAVSVLGALVNTDTSTLNYIVI